MIVDELIKLQKQRGLTNHQFAEILGIHKISWFRIKRTRVIGADTLLQAFRVYPELREAFLSSFAPITPAPSENYPQRRFNQIWGVFWHKLKASLKEIIRSLFHKRDEP